MNRFSKIVLSILPVLGATLGILLEIEQILTGYVLSFALGVLFSMIIRDVIPQGKRGNPLLFFLGSVIIIFLWISRILI